MRLFAGRRGHRHALDWRLDFGKLLTFHCEYQAIATMGLNRFQYQLPYGVVELQDQFIGNVAEKPIYDFFANAGLYVVNPEALSMIPHDVFFDMPSLFQEIPPTKRVAFPIHEYWLDIGRHDDLNKASAEYVTHFGQNGK
jgi:NDP-sugar pyrophosphorylase family protein